MGEKGMSNEESNESKELVKIEKLTLNSREVNTIVKVVSKSEVRNVTGRDYSDAGLQTPWLEMKQGAYI